MTSPITTPSALMHRKIVSLLSNIYYFFAMRTEKVKNSKNFKKQYKQGPIFQKISPDLAIFFYIPLQSLSRQPCANQGQSRYCNGNPFNPCSEARKLPRESQ
jgi:hypothetical protein